MSLKKYRSAKAQPSLGALYYLNLNIRKRLYLAVMIDLYLRKIVGCSMRSRMKASLV